MALPAPTESFYQEITSAASTFVSASRTPTAGARLHLVWLLPYESGGAVNAPASTAQGGQSWTKIADTTFADGNTKMGSLWAYYGSLSAGTFSVPMAGVTHESLIVDCLEQTGVTSIGAIIQAKAARTLNVDTLTVTFDAPPAAGSSTILFVGVKAPSTGGATTITPKAGFTALRNDQIDATRKVLVAYKLAGDQTPSFTLTGDADGNYTAHHLWAVGIEVASAVPWVGKVQIIVDVDPATVTPTVPVVVPPAVIDVPSTADDVQSLSARPIVARDTDLAAVLAAAEAAAIRAASAAIELHGSRPVLAEDPANPAEGQGWIRQATGEEVYVVQGVLQVRQPTTPVTDPDRGDEEAT